MLFLCRKDPGYINKNIRDSQNQRDDEPLLKMGLDSPELLDGNWSRLCITCKWPHLPSINRLPGLYAQNIALHATAVLSNSIITALGYQIALESLSYSGLKLQRNKWDFFMFLILEVSAMIITGVTAIIRSVGDPASPASFGGWLGYTAINHSWVVSFVIMDLLLFLGVITLTVIQASQISRNITTNEMANTIRYSYLRGPSGRFRNPYDHGLRENCSDFLLKGYNEDIESTVQTLQSDEEMGPIQMSSPVSQNGESIPPHVNGTDHGSTISHANSKSHRQSPSNCLGLGLGTGHNNPSSRYARSLLPL
ncbi:Protein S-acyltransferase 24 [Zea mays]|uniref:Protein S-acyltransferase 24 n=1 Tax=Zea mays TaxID=4577 RepID=A0A3L6ET55_MAIZE|nr:Protein S-acyltransferase 24 [Zea mays]